MTGELLTPTDVRRLLDAYGLAPRKAAGQNFVTDPNTIRKIVRDAGVGPDDEVLEIGPGVGSLTLALAQVARRVVAVEVDAGLVRALVEVVGHLDHVEVVHADALRVDLRELSGPGTRVVANLPYHLATPLVVTLLTTTEVRDLFVMVQREVGQRWAAGVDDPAYGAVSAKLALLADVEVVAAVPRTVFWPVPNVDSVTVRLARRPDAPQGRQRMAILDLIDAAFAARRKTLRNNLRRLAEPERLAAALAALGLSDDVRAEQLPPPVFVALAAALDADPNAAPA